MTISRFAAVGVASTLGAALIGCGNDGSSSVESAERTIDVGYSFGFDAGDTADRVAFARLADEGTLRARLRDTGGPANSVAALMRGDVDVANMPYIAAVEAVASGANIRVILGANMAAEFLLVGRPGIDDAADLRGKTIVHSGPGSVTATLAETVVARAGLDAGDVKFRALQESPAKAAALLAGRADAAALEYVDFQRLVADHPGLTVIGRQSEIQPQAPVMVWAVSSSHAEHDPELFEVIVEGLLDSYEYAYTDAGRAAWLTEAKRKALAGDTPDLVRRTYDFYRSVSFWPRRREPVTLAQHRRILDFWLRSNLIEDSASFETVWDESFWRSAATR